MATTNPFTTNPYQPNQSTAPQTAAATNVTSPSTPTSFLSNVGNFLSGAWNNYVKPIGQSIFVNPAPSPSQVVSGVSNLVNPKPSTVQASTNTGYTVPKVPTPLSTNPGAISSPNPYAPLGPSTPQSLAQEQRFLASQKQNTGQNTNTGFNTQSPYSNNAPIPTSTGTGTGDTGSGNTNAQKSAIQSMAQPTLIQQVAQNLANLRGNNPDVQNAYNTVTNLESGLQAGGNAIQEKPIPLEFQQGQMAALQRDYGPQLTAAKDILQSEITGQGQELAGLQAAGGIAQPIQVPYSNQIINPLTGQPVNDTGTSTGLAGSIPNLATSVINGSMTIDQANSALGNTTGLTNQLVQEIQKQSPNFNFNQAAQNAQTQGTLAPQSSLATQELQNLQNTLSSVPVWQKTSIPAINALGSLVDNALGMGSSQALTSSISAARSAIETALGTAYSTTPTAFTEMVNSWIPNNPTPAQVQAAINQFNTLMKARVSSFASPGTTQNPAATGSGTSGNLYSF